MYLAYNFDFVCNNTKPIYSLHWECSLTRHLNEKTSISQRTLIEIFDHSVLLPNIRCEPITYTKVITTSFFRIAVNWYRVPNQTEIYVSVPDFVKHNASVSPGQLRKFCSQKQTQ